MKKKGIVYQVTNKISGRIYVGRTQKTTDLFVLVNQNLLYKYKYLEFSQDILQLGKHNFEFKILCEGTNNKLRNFKKNYLKMLSQNSVLLYNKTGRSNRKIIEQYDLQGNFIREWESIRHAVDNIRFSSKAKIINALKGRSKSAHGFIWKYKFDVS